MMISLIWAMSDDGVIGVDNRLPWKLPADMRWFRRHTLGKPVVMGRRTFHSLGDRPLPDRLNIVITREQGYRIPGARVVHSLEEALAAAEPAPEVMVIGGADLYRQLLPRADRLYMTLVHGRFEGDTRFPPFDRGEWRELEGHEFEADERNRWPYGFYILERRGRC